MNRSRDHVATCFCWHDCRARPLGVILRTALFVSIGLPRMLALQSLRLKPQSLLPGQYIKLRHSAQATFAGPPRKRSVPLHMKCFEHTLSVVLLLLLLLPTLEPFHNHVSDLFEYREQQPHVDLDSGLCFVRAGVTTDNGIVPPPGTLNLWRPW